MVSGRGFEPLTFGLWARWVDWLSHHEISPNCWKSLAFNQRNPSFKILYEWMTYRDRRWIDSKSGLGYKSNLWPNQNALLKLQNFLLTHFDFSINSSSARMVESVCWLLIVPIDKGFIEGIFEVLSHGDGLVGGRMRFWHTAFQRFHQAVKIRIVE